MKRIVVIMLAALATALGASAQGTVTRGPLEFTFNADIANPQAGNADLVWNGVDQLFQLWFWYRCPGDSMETPVPIPGFQDYNQSPSSAAVGLIWNDICGAQLQVSINLNDCSSDPCNGAEPGSWGQVTVYVGYQTPPPILPTLFIYSDLDVAGTAADDTASALLPGSWRIRDGSTTIDLRQNGDYFNQVTEWPVLRDALDDLSPTDLDGTGLPFGPGDFTGAHQAHQGGQFVSLYFELDNPFIFDFFADGFESGDLSQWSGPTAPTPTPTPTPQPPTPTPTPTPIVPTPTPTPNFPTPTPTPNFPTPTLTPTNP